MSKDLESSPSSPVNESSSPLLPYRGEPCPPLRRRVLPLRSLESLNPQKREALHQKFSNILEELEKYPDDGYIQMISDIWDQINPSLEGSEKLLEEKRLVEKLLVEEELDLDASAVRKFKITLQSIQKELSNLAEEGCRPTKAQRRNDYSGDGDPGSSSVGFASITLQRSSIQIVEPASFVGNYPKPSDPFISAVGFVVYSLVGGYFVIKLLAKVETSTIIQAINFLDLDIMQETELLTLNI